MSGSDTENGFTVKIMGLKPKHFAIVAAFLLGGGSGTLGLIQRGPILAFLIGPAMDAKAAVVVEGERQRADSLRVIHEEKLLRRLSYIEDLLERMPGGKEAARAIEREKEKRIFHNTNRKREP